MKRITFTYRGVELSGSYSDLRKLVDTGFLTASVLQEEYTKAHGASPLYHSSTHGWIPVSEMDTNHLVNAQKKLYREAVDKAALMLRRNKITVQTYVRTLTMQWQAVVGVTVTMDEYQQLNVLNGELNRRSLAGE